MIRTVAALPPFAVGEFVFFLDDARRLGSLKAQPSEEIRPRKLQAQRRIGDDHSAPFPSPNSTR